MWNMTCVIVPAIRGATGIVKNGLKKNLKAVPGNRLTKKSAVHGKLLLMHKILQCET